MSRDSACSSYRISTWAAGDHCDARLTGGLAVCLCHVGSAAFLAGNDGFDGVFHRAASDGEIDFYSDVIAVNVDGLDHIEFSDGAADLGLKTPTAPPPNF